MENNSDGKSLDLLSAALNQSGLINCDEKNSAIKKDDIHNIITSQDSTSTAQDKLSVSNLSTVAKPLKSSVKKSVSSHLTTSKQLVSIPGAKIIKLPSLATGSVIKIKKVVQLNNSSSNTPLQKKPLSAPVIAETTTVMQSNTNGAKIGKVVAGGKAIFIPIVKTKNTLAPPVKLVQSPVQPTLISSNTNNALNILHVKSSSGHLTSKKTITINARNKSAQNSSSLNLGSKFVEIVEKEVGSDFDTPPDSPFTVTVKKDNSDKHSESSKENVLNSFKTNGGKALNGTTYLHGTMKLSSSQSIPTIRLSVNNKSSQDKSKSCGTETLLRAMSLPLLNKRLDEELIADDEKEEEMQHAQTYSEYMPSKLQIGLPHPDSVVETSSLASITPPHVHYRLSLPRQIIDSGQLSALQLESIVYACQKHETLLSSGERAGFLIGDGAGVGKGRSVAGIIYENYLVGRKRALWFSVSNDLKFDAERDLRDIGAKHIKVYSLNKFKYGKITSRNNGAVKKGVIFATYSSLIGESHSQAKYHTRLKQLLHWCGEDFDGPIIFDECHKAKNLIPSGSGKSTKTGVTVLELQSKLPNARVVYASATGASEPRNMAYMSRLGLWGAGTPFSDFVEFIQAVERRGVGAMELVAMDMKLRGCYIARQLSFYGVSFKIEEVTLESAFIDMYNKSVRLWVAAREAFQVAAAMMEAEYHMKKSMWAQFWSAHQRFFKYLCLSAKVNHTVALVREAVKHGKCVVIGLQSTGEAGTVDQLEKQGGELEDFVSTAKNVFENVIERHFPAPDRRRVVALLGRDFYKKPDSLVDASSGKKRKLDEENKNESSKRMRRNSTSNDDIDSSPDDSSDDMVIISDDEINNFSDSSSISEEDIGKIFGDGSDSDDHESPVKKKKSRSNSDDESHDNDDDDGLKMKVKESEKEEEKPGLLSSLDLVSGTLTSALPGMGPVERAQALKKELLNRLEVLGPFLPNNMLDELIDALGGTENVAEMTGRKGRVISTDEGNVQYQSRAEDDVPVELLNITEKQRFMDGEKNIAIISEAASSGISLQADKRARNQRKRVHVTVELPWSADRAVQQFGRTHRSNQVNAPEYIFLITELAGEQRFASVVAKRLESLGALTHGDRRATESRDLSKFNYDNKYGRKALDTVMKAIAGCELPLVPPPASYKGNFFKDIRQGLLGVGLLTKDTGQLNYQLDKDYNNIFKFMNRILGMEVEQQNAIFTFFSDTLNAIIGEAKRLGEYDQGIMDVGVTNNLVERIKCKDFPLESGASVTLHSVRVERGTSWEEAKRILRENISGEGSGFYVTFQKKNDRHMVMLAIECSSRRQRTFFLIYRPNTGKQMRRENLQDILKKYRRVEEEEAQMWWEEQYQASLDHCSHRYWQGSCSRGGPDTCHVGMRRRLYHVLSGSVLQVWKTVESILASEGGSKYKMQIVRLKTSDGGKLVGLLIPSTCVQELSTALSFFRHTSDNWHFSPSADCDVVNHVTISDDDSDDYEEVDEIDPDDMLSSVLFSKKEFSRS